MKKIILAAMTTLPFLVFAEPTIPSIGNTSKESVSYSGLLGGRDQPLTKKEQQALSQAGKWVNGKQYISSGSDTINYTFGAGQPSIIASPLKLSVLELEPGERIVKDGIQLGDTVRWKVTPVLRGNQTSVIIKPVDNGLTSDLAVFTDRRIYHIKLVSNSKRYTPLVKFTYPVDENQKSWDAYYGNAEGSTNPVKLHKSGKLSLAPINFSYKVKGEDSMKPLRVYDDGKQVFIQMSDKIQEIPALFIVSGSGKRQMVNYRFVDNTYIVDRLFNEALLLLDVGRNQQEVTITREG